MALRSASLAGQWRLKQARSVKPGCIKLSDAWSVKAFLGYDSPTGADIFCWFDT